MASLVRSSVNDCRFSICREEAHRGILAPIPSQEAPAPPGTCPCLPARAHSCPAQLRVSVCPCVPSSFPVGSTWAGPARLCPTHLVLFGKELEELLKNLHVEFGSVPSSDHGGDVLIGAAGERAWSQWEQREHRPPPLGSWGTLLVRDCPQRTTSLLFRPELPGHREGNPPAWGRTVTWLEADSRAPCLSGHPCSSFLGAAQDPGRGLTHAQGPPWQEPALSSCREGPGGREHCPLLSGPLLPQGAGWGSPGPPVGGGLGHRLAPGRGSRTSPEPPTPRALRSPRGQGLGRTGRSPFKLLQEDVEVQALLGVQKGDLENTPPWCWYLWLHRDPRTPPNRARPAPPPWAPSWRGRPCVPWAWPRGSRRAAQCWRSQAPRPRRPGCSVRPTWSSALGGGVPGQAHASPGGQGCPPVAVMPRARGRTHTCPCPGWRGTGRLTSLGLDLLRPSISTPVPGQGRGCGRRGTSRLTRARAGGRVFRGDPGRSPPLSPPRPPAPDDRGAEPRVEIDQSGLQAGGTLGPDPGTYATRGGGTCAAGRGPGLGRAAAQGDGGPHLGPRWMAASAS